MPLLAGLMQDFRANGALGGIASVKGLATLLFRLSQAAGEVHPLLGTAVKQLNHLATGADIAWQARFGPGLALMHPTGVVVGRLVDAGAGCVLQSGVTLGGSGRSADGHPKLGDDVQIGTGARLLGPIEVGDRSVIGANAVVLVDVPADSIAVGVPARVSPRSRTAEKPEDRATH